MPDTRPIRVLAVEDNPADARILQELFREVDGQTFELALAETLAKAASLGGQAPELLLLDLNLPDSMGAGTLDRASALFPGVPVIVMTGTHEAGLGTALIKKGAQDYLTKGRITPESLAYSIRYSIERAKIDAELREKEGRLRAILEKCPDGFLVVDRQNAVLFANRAAEAIFGQAAAQLMKQPFALHADTERITEDEVRRPDKKAIPVEIRAVETDWGGADCRLIILRDLNPVRALQRSRDEFISQVSHELRSPLTVVKESLALLSDGTLEGEPDKQKEILRIGLDNAARLNRLIDGLLDLTKIEAGMMPMEFGAADLAAIMDDTARHYSLLAAEKSVAISKDLPPEGLVSWCDGEKLRQVIVNLVSNAVKFTPANGAISLQLRSLERTAVISVQNSGPGIEEAELPRLFQKFARISSRSFSAVKGTGLGLAISRGIVELHRGKIWAESRQGIGTCFFVRMPVAGAEEALRAAVEKEIELSASGRRSFCALTLDARSAGPAAWQEIESFLKTNMRSSRVTIKPRDGMYILLLPDCDKAGGLRTAAGLENCVSGLTGDETARATGFAYTDDFTSPEGFLEKWSEKFRD